jgi:hypothetical protein
MIRPATSGLGESRQQESLQAAGGRAHELELWKRVAVEVRAGLERRLAALVRPELQDLPHDHAAVGNGRSRVGDPDTLAERIMP